MRSLSLQAAQFVKVGSVLLYLWCINPRVILCWPTTQSTAAVPAAGKRKGGSTPSVHNRSTAIRAVATQRPNIAIDNNQ